jgi:hemoglobin-like flavoprotein
VVATVSDTDIRIVRESLPLVREHLAAASDRFYDNLFAIAPELRPLFTRGVHGQGMRFMTTLATIASLLDDPEALGPELDALARIHVHAGVRPEHFAPIGAALLVTFGEALGRGFTCRLQEAWRAAYDHIAAEIVARGAFAH